MSDTVKLNQAAIDALARRGGPTTEEIRRHARIIQAKARLKVRVKTGRMLAGIVLDEGEDAQGFYVDVATTARDHGFPYGRLWENREHYITGAARTAGRVSGLASRKRRR